MSLLDTLDFQYVGPRKDNAVYLELVRAAAELGKPLKLRTHVTSYYALCHMVHAGLGIGFLPEAIAEHFVKTLGIRVVALDEPWANRELKVYVRRYETLSVAARLLVDHLEGSRPS